MTDASHSDAASTAGAATSARSTQPTIDFSTFVLSLASSAMMHLGKVPDPMGGAPGVNLPLARQSIDMLAMLQTKTVGNLTEKEESLLKRLLHDVRMAWVELHQTEAS